MKQEKVDMYDLGVIQSNVENMLLNALKQHEESVIAYGEAVDAYSIASAQYDTAYAQATNNLSREGEKATLIPIIAKGLVASEKQKMIKAEGNMKKMQMLSKGFIERSQGIKFIGNRLTIQEKE